MEWITLADTRNLEYMHTREHFSRLDLLTHPRFMALILLKALQLF